MIIRLSKALLVCSIALFASLVVFGNITDYKTNFEFVQHVLMMDTIFPDATIKYRALEQDWIHILGYIFIIAGEALVAILCWIGGIKLINLRNATADQFNSAKTISIIGLTVGYLVWQVGFMTIGGEWFGMWMSDTWNGKDNAFQFFTTILLILIYLVQKDS